ncbi:MAG: AAA family ATPase [Pirellulales bacterium]|nr:AAA family ATPase [Pirellulales bacterium]
MKLSDREIVTALRAALAQRMGPQRLALWFGAETALALNGDRLLVLTPSPFFQEWLRRNFRAELQAIAAEVIGRSVAIEFTVATGADDAVPLVAAEDQQSATAVDATGHDPRPATAPPGLPRGESNERVTDPLAAGPTAATMFTMAVAGAVSAAGSGTLKHATDGAGQRPRRGRRFARLEQFAAGQVNRLALTAAQTVAAQLGTWSPLTLHGPPGVGKTHLLEGIWSTVKERRPETAAIYLTAEQFTTSFLEALRGSGLPSFRRKYRGVDLLIIDDIQFFVGKRATVLELLHTMNTLVDEGRQVVLAADRPVQELTELGPDVVQRLTGGMLCRLDPPDIEARLAIVRHLSGQLNLSLPSEVEELLAARLTQGAREISGALKRLAVAQLAHGGAITLEVAQQVLVDQLRQTPRTVRLPEIERAVCDLFGLDAKRLQTGGRARQISGPRALAMWLARKYTRAALSEIGEYFGCRSHTTVISAERKVGAWLANHEELGMADGTCLVEDALRRIERKLAVG